MAKSRKTPPKKAKPIQPAGSPQLAARPIWSGNLRLSLVSCPIALNGAVSHRQDISFHLLNPETNNRIKMVPTDPETGPVNRSELVKGYEFEKDRYVIVTPDELEAVRLETTGNLDIESFVDSSEIDRLFWDEPYFLLPGDDNAIEAYSVVREALARTNRIAIGRVVMHTRERLLAVEPAGKGLLAYTLRMRDEVIDPASVFSGISDHKIDPRMIDIAEKIISQSEAPFDTETFRDRYEEALRELVTRKQLGETIEAPQQEQPSNVIDLMEALRRSLKAKPADSAKSSRAKSKTRVRKKA